ncbi:MAG: NifB/NifX family molybdenum-iron cluster-binding protein [Nitrospirota bacterium]
MWKTVAGTNIRGDVVEVSMRIAIPIFGKRISPRFDFAPNFGLFDIEGKRIAETRTVPCDGWGVTERISTLKSLKVDILICGGVPNYLLCILMSSGMQIIPWVTGNAEEALSLFLQNRLQQGMAVCSGRREKRRCRGQNR